MTTIDNGKYPITEILTDEMRDMSIEQIIALLVYKIAETSDDIIVHVLKSTSLRVLEFEVDGEDFPLVLGKSGWIIDSIRKLTSPLLGCAASSTRYNIELIDRDQRG